jgi:hypothetical protein
MRLTRTPWVLRLSFGTHLIGPIFIFAFAQFMPRLFSGERLGFQAEKFKQAILVKIKGRLKLKYTSLK